MPFSEIEMSKGAAQKLIPIADAAQRVVDAVPEVVNFEISGQNLRFNFDRPRRIHPMNTYAASTTLWIGDERVPEWTVADVIQRLRAMLDGKTKGSVA
jgi:hypothetical protein